MYTEATHAHHLLQERRENRQLRQEVEEWLGSIPEPLLRGPRAVLARALATPNRESHQFAAVAERLKLEPLWMEYTADKFTSANPGKVALGKPAFDCGVGRNGGQKKVNHTVVNFIRWDGQPIHQVETVWGERLVDLHHRLLNVSLPGAETWEASTWLQEAGGRADVYYVRYLGLFLLHGVLCENFLTEGKEAGFTTRVVMPAIESLRGRFGVAPLIVPAVPAASAGEAGWELYDGGLLAALRPVGVGAAV